jgi:hypothetical protein
MTTMAAKPEDYYNALGRVAFAIGRLEECFIVYRWSLSETTNLDELKVKLIQAGFSRNITALTKLVKERFSKHYQDRILPLIQTADNLRKIRNENLHALWQVMVDAHTGEFVNVQRFRQSAPKGAKEVTLDVSTPLDSELTALAQEINQCAGDLIETLSHAYDMDENVRRWRSRHGW